MTAGTQSSVLVEEMKHRHLKGGLEDLLAVEVLQLVS